MKDVYLDINGNKLEISYPLLEAITRRLGNEEYHAPMVKAILGLNIPSLTRLLVDNENLTTEELDAIWANASMDLKLAMLDERNFIDKIDDGQAREIMDSGQPEMLKKIAREAERLYPDSKADHATRISGHTADELLQMIANHPDESVRKELAENISAPAKFRPQLDMRHIYTDMPPSYVRFITNDNVEYFKNDNIDVLITIAENIKNIGDKEARAKLGDYLVQHSDPAVRLALARNWNTPKNYLDILKNDPDAAIAASARDSLE